MFERYTEKARRVIFFARYEASQYGSKEIGTEHILLGLMREDPLLLRRFLGPTKARADLRADLEKQITRGERVSTSVEMPLSAECKRLMNLAAEEVERLAQRRVGTEHLLLALLGVKGSLASKVLLSHGLKPDEIRGHLAIAPAADATAPVSGPLEESLVALNSFLDALNSSNKEELLAFLAADAEVIDTKGRRWTRAEINKDCGTLFAPYTKKNATHAIEATPLNTQEAFVVSIAWNDAQQTGEARPWVHRMTIVLVPKVFHWEIVFAQVTAVASP
jgi:hypothetical protein